MSDPAAMTAAASAFLNEPVLATGIFAYEPAAHVGGIGGAMTGYVAASTVDAGPMGTAVAGAIGREAGMNLAAADAGVDLRMMVAVTESAVHVLDWHNGTVSKSFARFNRADSHISVTSFGASRTLTLTDPAGGSMSLTGSTGFLSSEHAGDKAVLAALSLA